VLVLGGGRGGAYNRGNKMEERGWGVLRTGAGAEDCSHSQRAWMQGLGAYGVVYIVDIWSWQPA
jgi:hypothetical protein